MVMTTERDSHRITVGQLRQNPTRMLTEVQGGERYVITSHGRPVADVVPHAQPGWVPVEQVKSLLARSGDVTWVDELRDQREDQDMRDPWA
ncbi:MAG: type II toxin-antitoxin system prevent-host-death family antitoxin [Leifsonia sp.]